MILSILIPTTSSRADFMESMMYKLTKQLVKAEALDVVEVIRDPRDHATVGTKRNDLLQSAAGEYVCFVDDDDDLAPDYINTILTALKSSPDCLSLRGVMTTNGQNPETFEHSLKYGEWRETTNEIKYERYPNHLNVIRASIAKRFFFPEKNFGEDKAWSDDLHRSGLLKKEVYIDQVLYYYQYRTNK